MDKNSIIFLVIFFVIESILLTLNFTYKPKYEDDLKDLCKVKNNNYSTSSPSYLRLSLYFK